MCALLLLLLLRAHILQSLRPRYLGTTLHLLVYNLHGNPPILFYYQITNQTMCSGWEFINSVPVLAGNGVCSWQWTEALKAFWKPGHHVGDGEKKAVFGGPLPLLINLELRRLQEASGACSTHTEAAARPHCTADCEGRNELLA